MARGEFLGRYASLRIPDHAFALHGLADPLELPQGRVLSHPIGEKRIATRTRVASDVLDCILNVLKVDAVVLHKAAASAKIYCRK